MNIICYIYIFIFGAFLGSFLNLISDRLVNGGPIIKGRSKCDSCGKYLNPKNLIPLVSYLYQKGKCAFCGTKLSMFYPFSEILTGVSLMGAAFLSNLVTDFSASNLIGFLYLSIVFSIFIVIFLTDAKFQLIPDVVVFTGISFILLFKIILISVNLHGMYTNYINDNFGKYLIEAGYFNSQLMLALKDFGMDIFSSVIIALFFVFLILTTKGRGMGWGDVKLGFLIGLFNTFPNNFLAIFMGFVIGSVFSIGLIILGKKSLKDLVAFGPFLVVGSIVTYIWGDSIVSWYFGIM